ncbi:MAG TPA: hypothetical protein VGM72_12975 [Micropepsaceae bacterium]|jgi:hypothetical protein
MARMLPRSEMVAQAVGFVHDLYATVRFFVRYRTMRPLSLARRVEAWLENRRGECVCDNCIAAELRQPIRKNVQAVTSRLSFCQPGYCKYRATCSVCGQASMVTRVSTSML